MIFRLLICLSLFVMLGCSDSTYEHQPKEVSIAYLKSLCTGDNYHIAEDYTIRGTILATNWLGETNRSAIVVDDSGGLELVLDIYDIKDKLPIFSNITIYCNNLVLSRLNRKIVLGTQQIGDNASLGTINEDMFERYIRIEGKSEDFEFTTKQISEIRDRDISQVIRIDNLRLSDKEQGKSWCDTVEGEVVTTFRSFCDNNGDTLSIRILPTCRYSKERIPTKEISVIGVIDYSDDRYFLQIINKWII